MSRCDSYTAGNCTAGACQENPWIPDGLEDGGDWADNARARGFTVVSTPVVGSVVSYCRGGGYSQFGHVASVVAVSDDGLTFEVHEENFVGLFLFDFRWSSLWDVCGFILPPSGTGSGAGITGGGPGGNPGIPWQPVTAFDNVRGWTRDLGANLYGRCLNVQQLADQVGR